MSDDDEPALTELSDAERTALDAWEADVPPPGFADRVFAEPVAAPAPRRRLAAIAGFAGGALVAAAVALVLARAPSRSHAAAGARTVVAREEIALGRRGVAVAEAGASLAWEVAADGAARVEQGAGDVFYRVEPGGPFVVATAAGDVRVTGTCFRVEVQMKPSKSSLGGAAIGAALTAAVIVTVYEGGVIAASGGKEQPVAAGERVVLGEPAPEVAAAAQPPAPDATRDELLARDTTQRQTIQELAARVAGLEKQLAGGTKVKVKGDVALGGARNPGDDDGDGRPWFDPSPELLASWVEECRLRFDSPPIDGSEPMQLGPQHVAELGLEEGEVDVLNRAVREFHTVWRAELMGYYIEVTGDAEGAESMSPNALAQEIEDKAAPGEPQQVRERIVRERAGLEKPPTDLSQLSPVERFVRAQVDLGNRFEAHLAKAVGAERAHELRLLTDGWGHKSEMAGCPTPNPR